MECEMTMAQSTSLADAKPQDQRPYPGFVDWLVTLCEFLGMFAVSSSFFKVVPYEEMKPEDEEADEAWAMLSYYVNWSASIVGVSVAVIIVPRLVRRCFGWQWNFLRHPHFPVSIQLIKLAGALGNMGYLLNTDSNDYEDEFKLQGRDKLISAGILALCESVSIVNTLLESCCGMSIEMTTRGVTNYPASRESKLFIFFNLWKDFGIVSSLVKTDELLFLLFEFPWPMLLSFFMPRWGLKSQNCRYHLVRALLVGWGFATLFMSSKARGKGIEIVPELMVPLLLVGTEVVLALCEIWNGRAGRTLEVQQQRMDLSNPLV